MFLLPAYLVFFAGTVGKAASQDIFGTFTSFQVDRTIAGSGDISGYEIVVLPGADHPNVVFQCAVGDIEPPVLVAARVEDRTLSFNIPTPNHCPGHFAAHIMGRTMILNDGKTVVRLTKGQSYWLGGSSSKR